MTATLKDFLATGQEHGQITLGDDAVVIHANGKTDWFFQPSGSSQMDNVPALCFDTTAPIVQLSARVSVDFAAAYDAGSLFVKAAPDQWAKIAFERNNQAVPTIVSVVTRGVSDDSDGPTHPWAEVWLRISLDHALVSLHYSADGVVWRFLRFFRLDRAESAAVVLGFGSQSPIGAGCTSRFRDIHISYDGLTNQRDGS